jgi:hypothetical protein
MRDPACVCRCICAAAGVGLALVATPAGAVERENHLGVDTGGSMLVIADKSTPSVGAGLGAHWTYGLSDAFNLVVDGSWSLVAIGEKPLNASTPATRPATVSTLDAGIAYVLDVLRWVPWGGVLVGGYALGGGTIPGVKFLPGVELALGLDYRITRSWAAGVSFRQHVLSDLSKYPSYTQAFARLEYTWGW